jgi:hypothetical protein
MQILRFAQNDGMCLQIAMNEQQTRFARIVRRMQGRRVTGESTLAR